MFANFFTQASSNYDPQAEEEKKIKKQKYLEEKKRLEQIQKKTPQQLFDHYDKFEKDVNYFTDFMQS